MVVTVTGIDVYSILLGIPEFRCSTLFEVLVGSVAAVSGFGFLSWVCRTATDKRRFNTETISSIVNYDSNFVKAFLL